MSPLAARFNSLSLVSSASNFKPRAKRATAYCSYLVHLYPHYQLHRECFPESRAELLAIAAVVETGIRALRRMNQLCVAAIRAILEAPTWNDGLARWPYLVHDAAVGVPLSHLTPSSESLSPMR